MTRPAPVAAALAAALFALAPAAAPAAAQPDVALEGPAATEADAPAATGLGELQPYLFYGNRAAWTAQTNGTSYYLENTTDASNIQYFYVPPQPDRFGQRHVGVTLNFHGGEGMFGLLYAYEETADTKSYMLLAIDAQGTLRLIERSADGSFEERSSSTLQLDGPPRLELIEDGEMINIRVNGRDLFGLGNDRMGRGAVGIVAVGNGGFEFNEFTITAADAADAGNDSGDAFGEAADEAADTVDDALEGLGE